MNHSKSIEVLVFWQGTVVQAYHFNPEGEVFAGNQTKCDIFLPGQFNYGNFRLLRMNDFIEVFGFDGQIYVLGPNPISLEVPSSVLRIEIGLVSATQKPTMTPVFDWRSPESRTFLLSAMISLYIFFLTYQRRLEGTVGDKERNATVLFTKTFTPPDINKPKGSDKTLRPRRPQDPTKLGIFASLRNAIRETNINSRLESSFDEARSSVRNKGVSNETGTFPGFKQTGGGSLLEAAQGSGDLKIKIPGGGKMNATSLARGYRFGKSESEMVSGKGDESVSGFMDKEAIRQIIKSHLSEIRSCYEMKLNRDQNISGKLVVKWQILESGYVGKVNLVSERSSLEDRDVAKCTANVIKGLRFPKPPKGMIGEVQYPFVFSSR